MAGILLKILWSAKATCMLHLRRPSLCGIHVNSITSLLEFSLWNSWTFPLSVPVPDHISQALVVFHIHTLLHAWMHTPTHTHIQVCFHLFLHIVSSHHPCVLPLFTLLNRQTWRKSERDSSGHGYSCRDLVQRICNLHFKHAPKSVPGQQPMSALTLVSQRPAVQWILFAFEKRNEYSRHLFFTMTSFLFCEKMPGLLKCSDYIC